MSYKTGDKFIIEVDSSYVSEAGKTPVLLYKMKGFNSLVFDETGLDKLQKVECGVIASEAEFALGDVIVIDEMYYGDALKAVVIEVDTHSITILRADGVTDVIYEEDYKVINRTNEWMPDICNILTTLGKETNGSK